MKQLQILSKYPFLNSSKTYVKENDISMDDLLKDSLYERARAIGVERLDSAFEKKRCRK